MWIQECPCLVLGPRPANRNGASVRVRSGRVFRRNRVPRLLAPAPKRRCWVAFPRYRMVKTGEWSGRMWMACLGHGLCSRWGAWFVAHRFRNPGSLCLMERRPVAGRRARMPVLRRVRGPRLVRPGYREIVRWCRGRPRFRVCCGSRTGRRRRRRPTVRPKVRIASAAVHRIPVMVSR